MKTQINNQKYGAVIFLAILAVLCGQNLAYGIDVADRTPQVRDAIVAAAGVGTPEEVTADHLAAITTLDLASKNITTLKIGDFDGLTSLEALFLNNNHLTDLSAVLFIRSFEGTAHTPTAFPETVFNGLTSLRQLYLNNNRLTFLREAVFSGLTSLQYLYLHNNTVDPLEMTVSLEKVAEDAFKAVALTGAPFDMRLPIRITNGSIVGGATALTIPQGSLESETFTVTQTPGTVIAATVDIEALPALPHDIEQHGGLHQGYVLVKSDALPLVLPNVAPVFKEGATATRTIAENTASGTNIGAPVTATDANNDPLTYTLAGRDAAAFRIISRTGQLRTHAALDYETKNAYTVSVAVSDGNGGTDSITVRITLTDVYENRAPVFLEGRSTTRAIAENTTADTNIGTPVAAIDPDNDPLTYTLSGTDASSFSIVSTTGQIQAKNPLDYETKNVYEVSVAVDDDNGGTDSITVTINVTDVDENSAPVFTEGDSTTRAIAENTATGTDIGTPVAATDADNDTLTYTLSGTDSGSFGIVSTSGQLQTSAALDYETKTSYTVTVSVSDGNGGTDTITVTINVTNVNEAPTFTEGDSTTRSVAENIASGTNIGTAVAATDVDTADTLTYTLSGPDAAAFSIVTTTGQLQTSAPLDFETQNAYAVTVSVSDGNGGTDSITVTINITDVNEVPVPTNNAPAFTEGTATTRSVAENTASGTDIGTPVAATDADNDTLTYTLGGTDSGSFGIISTSGQLQTSAALDREAKSSYEVTVSVSDGNGGTDSITVTINITDVNETPTNNAPVFTDGLSTTRAIAENTATGTDIGTPVAATDADGDTLTYNLTGTDASSFSIVSTSGQLQTGAALDYETQNAYSVTVSVSDGNGGTDTITVTINITDVNETPTNNAPVFTDGITTTRAFHILSTSGQLQTNAALDYETKTFYSVTASVSDGNGGTDSITVTINVTDVDEIPINPPLSARTQQVQDAIVAAVPGVNNANDVTAAHLAAITVLSIADKGITSLKSGDFDGLTGITELYLHKNSISDISPLGGLTSLKTLYLRENSIRDISPLANLTALIKLTLGNNSIRDIPLFENLTNLTDFYLESNSIEDISPLKNMTSLKFLILDNNSISDISPLKNLTNLTDLYLDNTSIEDISALKNLTNLTDLYLHSNSISDISPLKNLTNLEDLNLYNTSIKDISSLENLISLVVLGLNSNSIEDISPLKNMTSLVSLELSGNSISDISPLENMNALVWLSLDGNPISDYGPLHRLKRANPGVNIDINLNNNPPQFSDGDSTTRAIPENTAVGTNIGTAVAATDTDNHTLTYTLSGNPDAEAFSIVKTSGQLQTKGALDYETQASYTVTVTVYDGNSGGDRISVTITVTDVVGAAPPVETPPMIPENTALLTNFPNPFNPETWIPYQLAKPAKVTLTIYNMRGVVVRELKLGHQPAGMYHSRNRALYWDGRNMFGEQVAAGVYFYTLTTGDFTATRKLLIRK